MSEALYAIAKAPRAGLAKTRLGQTVGDDEAVLLYRAFLQDLAARFSTSRFALGWYVTPPDAWPEIRALTGETGPVLFQAEGDLIERQRELFREAAERGEEKVILIATDSPHLTVQPVEEAFRVLDDRDLVLGPTLDGGYYLIGLRGYHDFPKDVPMSTDTALDDVLAQAQYLGLSVGMTEKTFDVDEEEDLLHLRREVAARDDLPATRDALGALGLLNGGPPEARRPRAPMHPRDPAQP